MNVKSDFNLRISELNDIFNSGSHNGLQYYFNEARKFIQARKIVNIIDEYSGHIEKITDIEHLEKFADTYLGPKKIFCLTAINPEGKMWECSDKKNGSIIVRARTESDARTIACQAYGVASVSMTIVKSPVCPWRLIDYVTCKEINSPEYSIHGDLTILKEIAK